LYIKTDDDHNITELIFVGAMPEKNGFEVDSIDEDIINNILEYKYIDGEFIKNEPRDLFQENIEIIRLIKIENMSSICHTSIENGITINGSHYSLTSNDQMEMIKLESIARMSPDTPVFYHADGEKCRLYSADEFINITTMALGWITYHRTYFNLLKSEILESTNAHDIIDINYGTPLNSDNQETLNNIMNGVLFEVPVIDDGFDYESLFAKVDISSIYRGVYLGTAEDKSNEILDISDNDLEGSSDNEENDGNKDEENNLDPTT